MIHVQYYILYYISSRFNNKTYGENIQQWKVCQTDDFNTVHVLKLINYGDLQKYKTYSMIEQLEKSQRKIKKNVPKGCFEVDQLQKYVSIKNYLLIKDVYNIACPFHYQLFSFVIVKTKSQVLELYHEASKRLMLQAIPKNGQIGSKFLIVCPNSDKVVGRMKGDLFGNKFFVFDGGNNPSQNKFPSRKQLVYVYSTNTQFFSQKPSNFTAVLANHVKRIQEDDETEKLGTLYEAEGIIQLKQGTSQLLKAEKENSKRVYTINSIQPEYCPKKKGYVMDLKGLVNEPSPINMVMKTEANLQCLLMGKRSMNTYLLYIGTPLTLLQGFGIFLANYVAKKQ